MMNNVTQADCARGRWLLGTAALCAAASAYGEGLVEAVDTLSDSVVGISKRVELLVPVGGVIMFWGPTNALPEGYELCDGAMPNTEGAALAYRKPDLRERFVMGAQGGIVDVAVNSKTGGMNKVVAGRTGGTAITKEQMAPHGHDGSWEAHRTLENGIMGTGIAAGAPAPLRLKLLSKTYVVNKVKIGVDIEPAGGGKEHDHSVAGFDNRPAFVQMFYIIRVK